MSMIIIKRGWRFVCCNQVMGVMIHECIMFNYNVPCQLLIFEPYVKRDKK